MVELADIFRTYGPAYRTKYDQRMPPSHRQAMVAIEACRTEALGGHLYHCSGCEEHWYSYHSCRNRHCPKCQQDAGQAWLVQQQSRLLPTSYFLVTFTLPEPLRRLARSHQTVLYNLLFRCSATALQQLALDPRFVGGQIGMVGILQTWTRDLRYHPHVHYLVTGGGLAADGQRWLRAKNHFFVHVKPLARLMRAKFRDALRKYGLLTQTPASVWRQDWVVDCRPAGNGERALKYLAPYVFRVALSNNRILKADEDRVTFRYRDGATRRLRICTLSAERFIHRFLHHVLPKGFVKVRSYGLLAPGNRARLRQAQALLAPDTSSPRPGKTTDAEGAPTPHTPVCPQCGQPMQVVQRIQPKARCPP